MKITVNVGKGVGEVDAAIAKLKAYRESLVEKNRIFAQRVAELGATNVNTRLSELSAVIPSDEPIGTAYVENTELYDVCRMRIVVASSMILFVEFGTGIRYSGTVHPKAGEMGYGAGTYPGKGHWDDPNGWSYQDGSGVWHHTYGIRAQMPMFNAAQEMRAQVLDIAKEVFGSA
jgi:hypothetical protein